MTENQLKRLHQLGTYVREVKDIEKIDFDKWFEGKKEFSVNILAYIILIEEDE